MPDRSDAAAYHAWYQTARGRWVGDVEFRLLRRLLQASRDDSILDVGCGTGYFTHRFAQVGNAVIGMDPALDWLAFAAANALPHERYVGGRAEALPFPDDSFDHTVSVAALCFMPDARPGIAEIVRVTRRRFAIGLLNRRSLLYRQKGRNGGTGAYRGARWHTASEVRRLFEGLAVRDLVLRTAIFEPGGHRLSHVIERLTPNTVRWGALIVACGRVDAP